MGVFPYLRSLHLDVWCHSMALTLHPPSSRSGPSSPRTRLTAISIHPYPDVLPLHLAPNPETLPALQCFVGVCQHVATLPPLETRLAELALLRAVVSAYPELTTLRVMFPVNFGMKIPRAISTSLQHLPLLRSFTLYKAHRLTGAAMLRFALLFAHPALTEVHLAWFAFSTAEGAYVLRMSVSGAWYVDMCECGVCFNVGVFER
ncbi:hypothetical protein B0H13DRAFT_2666362 [Mycena leptocephala]|nr:hypothetical protein B0H13DRAFT_2666362 [Mycena leptocephala]